MKTVFSSAKRCLALVLALLLMIPAMSVAFASGENSTTVGQLMVNSYDDLTEAEKDFLSHGLLSDTLVFYAYPGDDSELITVDKDMMTISVKDFDDGNGNIWTIDRVDIVVGEEVMETVEMTRVGNKSVGDYTYDGNAFAVKVYLDLNVAVDAAAQQALLDAMAALRAGYDALQGLFDQNGYVEAFEDVMPDLVDAANNGIETGFDNPFLNSMFPTSKTIVLGDATKAVILNLNDQMTANGGRTDLGADLSGYAAGHATEFLLNGDIEGLLANANALADDLGIIHSELSSQRTNLQTVIDMLVMQGPDWWATYGVTQEDIDKLNETADTIGTLASAVNALKGVLVDAVDTDAIPGWTVDLTGVLAAGVDYAHLDEHVIALGAGYTSSVTPVDSLYAASVVLQHNMSMKNVTVKMYISTVVGNVVTENNMFFTSYLTLMDNATKAEIEAAIEAGGIQPQVEDIWANAGLYVEGQFDVSVSEIPETLTEDITVTISYTPKMYTVNGAELVGTSDELPYGYLITLPVHEDINKAYDYTVNGEAYAQGSIVMVDQNMDISRTEGRAYTAHSLFKMIAEQFGNGEYELLSVRALTVKDQNVAVRYPTNGDNLVTVSGTTVTADTFRSDYAGLVWKPISVDVYFEDVVVETVPMENGTASITADNFDYVSVNYELVLTNITAQEIVDVLNLAIDLKNEAAAQRECMAILADNLEYLQMLDKTMLGIVKGLAEQYCWPETIDAVVFLQNNSVNPVTGKLYLTEYMEFYTSDNGGLWYYYQNGNWAKIKAEVDKMLPYMQQIKDDPGIKTAMEIGVGGVSYGDKYEAIPSLVDALSSANFTGPNEVINLYSSFLGEFITALDNWVPAQTTHYAPEDIQGYLTLGTNLTKTAGDKVQILINVEVKDKFGVSTTGSYGPVLFNAGVTLDAAHKQEILDGVKAVLESIDPYYSDEYTYAFGVAGSDLETELMNALSGALTADLVLYYNWNEICYHENYIKATCASPALCEVCGQYFGEIDPENHNWNEGIVYTPATCTETGWTLYTCSWCHGEELRNDIPATGHNWTEWMFVTDDLDNHWRYCQNDCGEKECENHSWDNGKVTTPATCETDGVLTYTCSICDGTYTEVIPATGHSYTNYVSNGDATCTENGTETAVCDNGCGKKHTRIDEDSALGHDFNGKCHDFGEAGHAYQCTRCDVIEEARRAHKYEGTNCAEIDHCTECGREKPAGEHTWGEWKDNGDGTHTRACTTENCPGTETESHDNHWSAGVVTTKPTCTEPGVLTYTCNLCGATKTEEIPANGHVWGEWTTDGADTHSRECTVCGEVEAEPHSWTEWTSDDDATHSRECTVCGEIQTAEHEWDNGVVSTPASCEKPGVMTYTCTVCGHTHDTEIPATGHSFTNYVYDGNATCLEDGTATAVCDNGCGKTDTIAAPGTALGHDFTGEWVSCGAEGHAHKCIRCDVVEEARYSHNYDSDTCTESATCVDCSYVKPAGDHAWGEWVDNGDGTHTRTCTLCDEGVQTANHTWNEGVVTIEATCTTDGEMLYTCTACGATKTEVIPATGHNFGDWFFNDDDTHSRVCLNCYETETAAHEWDDGVETKAPSVTETGVLTYTCSICNHTKTQEIPVIPPVGTTGTDCTRVVTNSQTKERFVYVDLSGDQGSIRYDLMYTISITGLNMAAAGTYSINGRAADVFEVYVPVTNEMAYNFNLTQYFLDNYQDRFASRAELLDALYKAQREKRISVGYNLIDTYSNKLYDFVENLDAAANGALDFSLITNNGNFSIVANLTNPAAAAGCLVNVATQFVFSGYSYFGIETVNGFVPFFADFGDGSILLSLQSLIDGLLCEDGFGTETIIELSKGNAVAIPGAVVVDGGNIGGYLQKTRMQIGTDASAIQYTVDFYLTMDNMAELAQVADALEAVKGFVTAETRDGELFVELNLPEKVYEVYLALMLATGEVDKSDAIAVDSAIAFRFLYDYLDLILSTNADTETFTNTLKMLGQTMDLTSYEQYYQTLKGLLVNGTADAMGGDVVANLDLNKDAAKGALELIANAKTTLNTLVSKAGMGDMSAELNLLIKEYKYEETLTVSARAELAQANTVFEVAVIDIRNGSLMDKADFAANGVGRINSLAGEAAVVLLADITGNLVFNSTTILDLNGHTITGNIVANGKLIIVDSSMDSDDCGLVDGDISGNVTIIAGNYTDNVSDYLAKGYVQNGTAVTNALYTIDVDAAGNITFNINSDVTADVADGYIPSARELAVDIALDLVLNYITTAALAVDGQDLYAIDLTDVIGLVSGSNKLEKGIDELLSYIKVDTGITNFINKVIDALLDFETIADALENETPVATFHVATKPWMIHVDHNVAGDYIEIGITNNEALKKEFDLNLVITGDNIKNYVLPLVEELADVVTSDIHVQLYQPQFDNNELYNVGGTLKANVALDLTGEYPVLLAIIMAYNGVDMGADLNTVLASYQADPSCAVLLKDEIDALTIAQIISALKNMNRANNFQAMAKAVGIDLNKVDIGLSAKLQKAYHLFLVGSGAILDYLDIVGPSTTLASLERAPGVYAADKFNISRNVSRTVRGYTVTADVLVEELSLTISLFGAEPQHSLIWVDNGDGTHDQICEVCGTVKVNDEAHVYDNDDDAFCNKCGYERDLGDDPILPPTPPTPPTPGHCPWCDKDVCHSAEFSDLNLGMWYHAEGYTDYVLCRGLMIGMVNTPTEKIFAPDIDTTRAMIVMTLYRLEGAPAVTGSSTYADVQDGAWYADAVIWATEKGIVEGYGDGFFGPNDYVTREQIDTIFYRYAKYSGMDVSKSDDLSRFSAEDVAKISDWALPAVKWAVAVGLMEGRGNSNGDPNSLDPRDATTRAEAAALLYRWCEEPLK